MSERSIAINEAKSYLKLHILVFHEIFGSKQKFPYWNCAVVFTDRNSKYQKSWRIPMLFILSTTKIPQKYDRRIPLWHSFFSSSWWILILVSFSSTAITKFEKTKLVNKCTKGQLISKTIYCVLDSPKKRTKTIWFVIS